MADCKTNGIHPSSGNAMNGDANALDRVANLPVVISTWNAMHSYYNNVKERYPTVTPYLEAAENMTVSAANMALSTSKPVVDKIAPTVNCYANKGLDKLEDKVPIIMKQPEEIYEETKSKAVNLLTDKVNSALDTTEKYVDYYLPSDEDEKYNENSLDDDTDDSDLSSDEDDDVDEEKEQLNPRERMRVISLKVRQRSYKKAVSKWRGVHARSREALGKLNFTVDLIQYAQTTLKSSDLASAASEKVSTGVVATLDGLHSAADSVNKQVEQRVMVRARMLSEQLHRSCQRAFEYVQRSPHLQHLLEQAKRAREATEDFYSSFAGKTSIAQLSASLVESARPKIKLMEESLMQLLENLADQPPIAWLAPEVDVDPLGGMDMQEIMVQLYGPVQQPDDVETRPRTPKRKQG